MNVLFVYTSKDNKTGKMHLFEEMQFGISYISSYLKKHGHQTRLLYLTGGYKSEIIDKYIEEFNPELICFTSVFTEYSFIVSIAKYIKQKYPSIFLLLGGVHATLNPEDCIKDPFDALCVGEGERPTLELIEKMTTKTAPTAIQNLWIKRGTEIEKNSPRPFNGDLDALPFPDRDMWLEWIANINSRKVVFIGRGCPFQCTYCCNHVLRKVSPGDYVRYRSPDGIVEELAYLKRTFPDTREVYLEVETFTVNMKWALDVCEKLEKFNASLDSPISFGVNLRPMKDYDKSVTLFQALKRSNFRFINIGLESGSERVRRDILKRHYSNHDVIQTVTLAKEYGLEVSLYVLIGIPGETVEDFRETIRVLREASPNYCMDSIFYPYPGTELFNVTKREGYIKETDDAAMERQRATLDMPHFSKSQIMKSYIWFDYYIYNGKRSWYHIYPRVFNKMLKAYPSFRVISNNYYLNWARKKLENYLIPSNR